MNKRKIPTEKLQLVFGEEYRSINYNGSIFIIEKDSNGNSANIQYAGCACKQAIVQGFIFKDFTSNCKYFKSKQWDKFTVWSNDPLKVYFQSSKLKVNYNISAWKNGKESQEYWKNIYKQATELAIPCSQILNTILREIKNETNIKFELDFENISYGVNWAEAYIPLKYNDKKYLLTWENCD